MPPVRGKARKAPTIDISDSSSQASEDNVPPKEPSKGNRVALHFAAKNPDRPDARMNGQYGMFSQCSPHSPPLPTKMPAKRKRASMDKRESGVNKKIIAARTRARTRVSRMEEESSEEREESPLFEPEESRDVHIQGDMDADAVMLSPPLTSASEDLLPNGRKGRSVAGVIPRSCSKRPIIIESGSLSSNSDSHSDTGSNILVSAQPDPTTKVLRAFLDLSPLSGDCSRIDEYIDVLDKLAAKNTAMGATKQYTDELANEEASITLAIEGIPAEQKQQLAAIAQACAKGIQADMATPSIATDMSAIQAAIETRNREAEVSRQSVLDLTKKKGEELLAKRLEVRRKREDALEECKAEVKLGTQSLQETRRRLEEEGGMAMMVELGRRIERLEGAGAKNDRKASARWG